MIRRLMRSAPLALPLLVFAASPASATTATAYSGSFTRQSLTLTNSRLVGRATYLEFVDRGESTGTFDGTYVGIDRCLLFPTGDAVCQADVTTTGTVAGVQGTIDQRCVGTFDADNNNPGAGVSENRCIVVGGTGDLTGVRGHGTTSATVRPDGSSSGTYSGQVFLPRP